MTSPFGPLVLIANPNAGRGTVGKALPRVESVLTRQEPRLPHRPHHPSRPRHRGRPPGPERRRALPGRGGRRRHRARGGQRDGQGRRAGGGGRRARGGGRRVRLRFRPVVRPASPTPNRPPERLAGDRVRTIDVGTVTCADGETRCFVNIAEVGLGACGGGQGGQPRDSFLGGARYAAGFWLTLPRFRPAAVRLDANGQYHAWRAFNVVVANCRFYGGGMQISPNSDPGDCLLDILVMTGPKSDSFTTLPKVYKGAHLPHRNIAELRAAQLSIEAEPGFPVEADGELLGMTPASFGIIPGAIRLKV